MIKLLTFESVKTVGNLILFKGRNNTKSNYSKNRSQTRKHTIKKAKKTHG